MPDRGIENTLRDIVGSHTWILTGVITEIEPHPKLGYLASCAAKPNDRFLQARLLFLGTRPNGGSLDPVSVGDEVVILLPSVEGVPDPNKAIAIAGLNSALMPLPGVFDNTAPVRIHPDGYSFRQANADAVSALVRKQHLDDFATWLGAFDAFLLTTSTAVTAPQIAVAAALMITTLTGAFSSPTGFTTRVSSDPSYRSTGIESS